jgi:hypothetical protein
MAALFPVGQTCTNDQSCFDHYKKRWAMVCDWCEVGAVRFVRQEGRNVCPICFVYMYKVQWRDTTGMCRCNNFRDALMAELNSRADVGAGVHPAFIRLLPELRIPEATDFVRERAVRVLQPAPRPPMGAPALPAPPGVAALALPAPPGVAALAGAAGAAGPGSVSPAGSDVQAQMMELMQQLLQELQRLRNLVHDLRDEVRSLQAGVNMTGGGGGGAVAPSQGHGGSSGSCGPNPEAEGWAWNWGSLSDARAADLAQKR